MNRSMITATNTMSQLQKQMDTIGNNLANINTTGYKKREVAFSELLVQQFQNQPQVDTEGRNTPFGIRQGVGAKIGHTNIVTAQGALKTTERPLDFAFTKPGQMLQVSAELNGTQVNRYTRDGELYLSPHEDGTNLVSLVTSEGNAVLDSDGDPIVFSDEYKDISISKSGTITINHEDGPIQSFDLAIVQVNRPQLLEGKGNNLFGLTDLAALEVAEEDVLQLLDGDLRQEIGIEQGVLEQSNVDMAAEMSELLVTQRSYQFNAKSISIADQMMGLVNGIR